MRDVNLPDSTASIRMRMLSDMMLVRAVEDEIAALYADQEIRCPVHLCTGQEAIPAAIARVTRPGDKAFSHHRSHGHYLCHGGSLTAMVAELYGRAAGCSGGKGGSQHLTDLNSEFVASSPILASLAPVAVGMAEALRRKGTGGMAICYLGDGATEEGAFHEALNLAALRHLPVLFVIENNQWSVQSPRVSRQPVGGSAPMLGGRLIHMLGRGHCIDAATASGNDPDAVLAAAEKLVDGVRNGNPALLECLTWRRMEHCGPRVDDDSYRPESDRRHWDRQDPIETYIRRLNLSETSNNTLFREMVYSARAQVVHAFDAARAGPRPAADDMYSDVWGNR